MSNFYLKWGKRLFDFIISFFALLVLCIPILIISLSLLLVQGLPIIFQQKRVGHHGKIFNIYKFRTMRNNCASRSTITAANDNRITPLGRFLRNFKIDELPQLFNILCGKMSFVGPRPDVPGYMDTLSGNDAAILNLRPGITCPASILFRKEEEMLAKVSDSKKYNDEVIFPEKVRLNLIYYNNLSMIHDIKIILATLLPKYEKSLLGKSYWLNINNNKMT